MANYNADIFIGVKGLTKLNTLERKLKSIDALQTKIRKPTTVKLNTALAVRQIGAIEKRLKSLDRTVNVRVNERRNSSGSSSSSSSSAGDSFGAGAGLVAGLAVSKKLNKELALSNRLTKELDDANQKVSSSYEEQNAIQKKIIAEQKRIPNLQGQVTRITNQNNRITNSGRKLTEKQVKSLQDAEFAVSQIKKEIRELEKSTSKLNVETAEYVKNLEKAEAVQQKQAKLVQRQQRLSRAGKSALAGAAFSNVPGQDLLAAGAAGALVGGPAGAGIAAGVAGILKLTTALAGLAGPAAKSAAELEKLQIALRGVVGQDYPRALLAVQIASEDFNQTLQDTTKQFTQLSAAGVANGNTVAEIENLYRGLAAATKATGGSAEDLTGVLRAATQVLSKGKVQAEELRGQIGDRLPGAFALFAEATGRTAAQLDKDLEQGRVSAEEFVDDFADFIRTKYEPAAFLISKSPAEAGARLERQLKQLQRNIGPLLQGIGAEFQIFAEEALKSLDPLFAKLNEFFKLDRSGKNTRLADLEKNKIPEVERLIRDLAGRDRNSKVGIPKIVAGMFDNAGALRSVDYVFNQAGKKLVEFQARAQQLRNELFPPERTQSTLGNNPLEEKEEKTTKTIKNLLGIDWSKLIGLEESRLQLKITEQQGQALVDGNRELYNRLEFQRSLLRTELEIEALTKGIVEAEARVAKYANDELLSAQAQNQLQDLKNAKLERELDLKNALATEGNNALKDDLEAAEAFGRIVQGVQPLNKELNDTQKLFNEIGGTLKNGLVDGLVMAVSGTEKLGEAFRNLAGDILQAVGKALILNAISGGLSALGGKDGVGLFSMLSGTFGGGRAAGGPVSGGTPYIVGEQGPELFVPGQSGSISNNDQFNAARQALSTGTANAGNAFDENADALGVSRSFAENSSSISTTTNYLRGQSEAKAQEAAIAAMTNDAIRVEVDTVNVGGMDVISKEQFAVGMQKTAKQARAQVFSDLKNRPATRRQMGIA